MKMWGEHNGQEFLYVNGCVYYNYVWESDRCIGFSNAVYGISILLLLIMVVSIVTNPISFKILNSYSYKKIIIFTESLNGIVTFGIFIFAENFYLLIILATISSFLNILFRPAFFSLIPSIVEHHQLNKANSILSSIDSAVTFLGYSISGIIIFYCGMKFTFLIDAFSYLLSVPLYFCIKGSIKQVKKEESRYFAFLKNNLDPINFFNINLIVWIVCGFFSALEIPFLKTVFNYEDSFIGNIFSIAASGNISGAILSSKFFKNIKNIKTVYLICSFLIIIKPFIYVLIESKIYFLLFGLISGVLIVLLKNSTSMFIFLQKSDKQNRYFNYLFLVNHIGMGFGLILATVFGDRFNYSQLLMIISSVALGTFIIYFFMLKKKNSILETE